VRSRTTQRPDAVVERHRIHAGDPTRIEVVLQVSAAALRIGPDDRDAVRRLVDRNLPALDEEAASRHPLEHGSPAQVRRRRSREQRFDAPLAYERLEGREFGAGLLLFHDRTSTGYDAQATPNSPRVRSSRRPTIAASPACGARRR